MCVCVSEFVFELMALGQNCLWFCWSWSWFWSDHWGAAGEDFLTGPGELVLVVGCWLMVSRSPAGSSLNGYCSSISRLTPHGLVSSDANDVSQRNQLV